MTKDEIEIRLFELSDQCELCEILDENRDCENCGTLIEQEELLALLDELEN